MVFFSQKLSELLFDYSLDSYKPMALNAPYLCKEALGLIDDIENNLIELKNLQYVIDELVWSIRNDKVAKSLLDIDLEKYTLDLDKTSLSQVKLRLEVLYQTLEPRKYLEKCTEMLKSAIYSCSKSEINSLTRLLITTTINTGVGKTHLFNKTNEFFYNGNAPEINSLSQIDEFLDLISPVIHDFDIFFICSPLVNEVKNSVKAFKIEIIDNLPDELQQFANDNNFTKNEDEVFIQVKGIRKFDCHSARDEGERRLDVLKDLFTLFYHKNQISWHEKTLLRQCCVDSPTIVSRSKSSMDKAFDLKPQRASKELNWLIRNLALKFGGSFKKFNRIVDLHGICVENDVPENQLLNLWISIETLVPSEVGKNKINNVIRSIDPFIRLTYIKRLVDRFIADLMLWDSFVSRKILRKILELKGQPLHRKVTALLCVPEHENLRKELYSELKDFHLLRFRAFQLTELLQKPQNIKKLLDEHSQKVAWQIRRMYRTRNLIVHSGRTPKYIQTLIENGHDYLDLILNEIMNLSCGEYKLQTIDQAFELESILLQKYEKKLFGQDKFTNDTSILVYHLNNA